MRGSLLTAKNCNTQHVTHAKSCQQGTSADMICMNETAAHMPYAGEMDKWEKLNPDLRATSPRLLPCTVYSSPSHREDSGESGAHGARTATAEGKCSCPGSPARAARILHDHFCHG